MLTHERQTFNSRAFPVAVRTQDVELRGDSDKMRLKVVSRVQSTRVIHTLDEADNITYARITKALGSVMQKVVQKLLYVRRGKLEVLEV
jgi:hypothetical protein